MKLDTRADVIIIGAGLAGLYTALNIDNELDIMIISKGEIEDTSSILAQGGIASCLNIEEDFNLYMNDTLLAGRKVNNREALETMITESKENIDKLIEFGVSFDRNKNNELMTTLEGGHSVRRVLHAGGDSTGRVIMSTLRDKIDKKSNTSILYNSMVTDINKGDNRFAVELINDTEIIKVETSSIIIATGGIGGLYKNSTNPKLATGDGIALGYSLGCQLDNLEYIQFHPTAFYMGNNEERFLISEAVRGEGGYLRNNKGKRFMKDIHPQGELAPRDIVARSIFRELQKSKESHVFLDITHRDNKYVVDRFPTIYEKCLYYGIDMSEDYIPVVPSEHYFIGGIKTDLIGRTNIKGVYACGECTNTGVHGANRLASNSLLECIVFGNRIAKDINKKFIRKN